MRHMRRVLRQALRSIGFDIVRYAPVEKWADLPSDLSEHEREVIRRIDGWTMTGIDRQVALIHAVRHVIRQGVAGSFVECGVWRGGSSMAMALTLLQEGQAIRDLYLFDTFEGMTRPQEVDRTADGTLAQTHMDHDATRTGVVWAVAGIEDVGNGLRSTGYPESLIHLVKGPVEITIPSQSPPGPIAILRLDTDWYESTRHELVHLFPLLADGGVLIIDDYGHWAGARKAVDEYFAATGHSFYMHRVDYTARLIVKR